MKRKFFLTLLFFFAISAFAQDTISYTCRLKLKKQNYLFYTSIELYPDSTFTWRSEYDLTFETYGTYKISKDSLLLKEYFSMSKPRTMSVRDSIKFVKPQYNIIKYYIKDNNLYMINEKGKKVNRIKDKSLTNKWSLFRHKFRYEFNKNG
ncbi:copper resistance protein NlpE [Flavobacterium sp. LaA7.5]|nr:copper resistance protein NlpE [Flavobacterium salilacus subsp. altitudinum]